MPRVSQTSSPLPRWKSTGSELLASFGRFIVFGGEELLEVVLATVLIHRSMRVLTMALQLNMLLSIAMYY
jgi:hypothetical protein